MGVWNLYFVLELRRKRKTYSILGSKELGANVLELQCVMLANHDQND